MQKLYIYCLMIFCVLAVIATQLLLAEYTENYVFNIVHISLFIVSRFEFFGNFQ